MTFLTPYFNQTDEELLQRVFLRTRWMKQHRFYKLNEVNLIFLTEDEIDDREIRIKHKRHTTKRYFKQPITLHGAWCPETGQHLAQDL